jgi:transposase-like protein
MYSYDDKIRAIELYIKPGKRIRATIRHLGFPTKNALRGWYSTTPDAELVNTMLDTAIETVADGPDRPIVHSDRAPTIDGRAGSPESMVHA